MVKSSHSTGPFHWRPNRDPRLLTWDLVLVAAIAVGVFFLATQANEAHATKETNASQDSASNAAIPVTGPINRPRVTDLITQLKDPAAAVRASAADALGSAGAATAENALLAATYDSDTHVREEAAAALGEIGQVDALPRLRELQIVQGNIYIELAAFEAQARITRQVATTIGVPYGQIQALTVAQDGTAYATAGQELYTRPVDGAWRPTSRLPDTPNNLSPGPDGSLVYLSTDASGLYRSQDAGKTWEHLQFGMQTPTQLTVTAVVVNPENVDQIFIALAANGSNPGQQNSLGVSVSNDSGQTWVPLLDSPTWSVTRTLIVDRTTPEFLYGLSDVGPWRYQLNGG
ncbi:MAG: HEAT repeat domain-containing protein [Chloroflexi bacterium]|nr:HEAT repeat domain-containing protein [Chloroflexota bacterium]